MKRALGIVGVLLALMVVVPLASITMQDIYAKSAEYTVQELISQLTEWGYSAWEAATGDVIFTGDILPNEDGTQNVGSEDYSWGDVYADGDVYIGNDLDVDGDITINDSSPFGILGAEAYVVSYNCNPLIKTFGTFLDDLGFNVWVCDGDGDDAPEIQAANEACDGGVVQLIGNEFNAGALYIDDCVLKGWSSDATDLNLTATLTVSEQTAWERCGKLWSLHILTGAGYADEAVTLNGYFNRQSLVLNDIHIEGADKTPGSTGLLIEATAGDGEMEAFANCTCGPVTIENYEYTYKEYTSESGTGVAYINGDTWESLHLIGGKYLMTLECDSGDLLGSHYNSINFQPSDVTVDGLVATGVVGRSCVQVVVFDWSLASGDVVNLGASTYDNLLMGYFDDATITDSGTNNIIFLQDGGQIILNGEVRIHGGSNPDCLYITNEANTGRGNLSYKISYIANGGYFAAESSNGNFYYFRARDVDGATHMEVARVESSNDPRFRFTLPPNMGDAVSQTISGGAITITSPVTELVVEGGTGAGADELDTISGGKEGDIIYLTVATSGSSDAVTIKDGTGNILLPADFAMDNVADLICLYCNGTNWFRVSESDNG